LGLALFVAWLVAEAAYAGTIAASTTAGLGNCNQASAQAGSASSACGNPNSYPTPFVTSAASGTAGSGLFLNVQATADVEAGYSYLLEDYGSASVSDSFAENLLVTGGSGSGSMVLQISLAVHGAEFGLETGGSLFATVDGTNVSSILNTTYPGWICYYGGADCFWQPSVPAQYVTVPFVFGVPFGFSEDFSLGAQANDGGSAQMSGGLTTNLFAVLDSDGNVVSGAQVADPPDAPEPASLVLLVGLLGLTAAGEVVRRRRISRQRRRRASEPNTAAGAD
jgi:hypothetical protein